MNKTKNFIFVFLLLFLISINFSKTNAKEIKTNKTNINVTEGKTIKIKVNCKNFKTKTNDKKYIKITKNKNSFIVKGLKVGKANILITKSNYKTCKIYVNIKKKINYKEITEKYNKSIKGLSNYCKNDIQKYKYFEVKNKKFYNDKDFQEQLNFFWRFMPDYLKNNLVKDKYKIIIENNKKFKGSCIGLCCYDQKKILLKLYKNSYGTIIHESAHAYNFSILDKYNIDLAKKCKEEYKKGDDKYGSYGSTNLREFYAEKTTFTSFSKKSSISDEEIANFLFDNFIIHTGRMYYDGFCTKITICINNYFTQNEKDRNINGKSHDDFVKKVLPFLTKKVKEKYGPFTEDIEITFYL